MDTMNSPNLTNYDLISQICCNNASLKQLFKTKKNINVENPDDIESWLEIISAINLDLSEKVGKIEVLLKWYKIMTTKQGYSQSQIDDTEKQISVILMELINTDLENIELDDIIDNNVEEYNINPDFGLNEDEEDQEISDNINVDGKIDLDFHFNFTEAEEETTNLNQEIEEIKTEDQPFKLDLDFLPHQEEIEEIAPEITTEFDLDFLPIQETIKEAETTEETPQAINLDLLNFEPEIVKEEIKTEPETPELNLDFIPLEETEIVTETKPEINFATASRSELIEETRNEEDQETVNLFDDPVPLEAAEENVRIFSDDEPITMEELQLAFNRISRLSMRYLGGTLTKNYFKSTQGEDPWSQKFQMNSKGQITVLGILSQEVTPQELITFKQWTSKFVKNCSTIISNFPVMVKKQNLLGRVG